MKKLLFIITAAMLTATSAVEAKTKTNMSNDRRERISPSENIITEQHTIPTDFTKIEASYIVNVIVEDRNDNTVTIRANENIMPHIELSVENGKLSARLDGKTVINMKNLVVEISVPNNNKICSVRASGASNITFVPNIQVPDFSASISGASNLSVNLTTQNCTLNLSGASNAHINFDGGSFEAGVSGASGITGSVNAIKSNIKLSGASKATLDGKSDSATVSVSGASAFGGFDFNTNICTASASGASNAEIYCTGLFSAGASGTSKVTYKGDCRVSSLSTSGMSSIKQR